MAPETEWVARLLLVLDRHTDDIAGERQAVLEFAEAFSLSVTPQDRLGGSDAEEDEED